MTSEGKHHISGPTLYYSSLATLIEGVLLVDAYGHILEADEYVCRIIGHDRNSITKFSIFKLDMYLTEKSWHQFWHNLQTDQKHTYQTNWINHDNQVIPVTIEAVLDPTDSTPIAVCRVRTSTTPVKNTIELLQYAAASQRVAVWEWDLLRGLFYVTDYFYQLFDLERIAGTVERSNIVQLLKDRLTTDQMEELTHTLSEIRNLKRNYHQRLTLKWDDTSKEIEFEIEPVTANDKVVGIRGMIWEVAPEGLSANTPTHAILDLLPALIWIMDADGNLVYANTATCRALGYEQGEVNFLKIQQVDAENTRTQWKSIYEQLQKETTHMMETSLQRKDGTLFPANLNTFLLPDNKIGICGEDITERRQQEARLQALLLENTGLTRQLEAENIYLKEAVANEFENIVSRSKAYRKVLKQIEQVAPTDTTVLIEGETGTGKELLARAIHRLSRRKDRPLVKVDCAALPEHLIESELFGHERGAFTGADKRRIGRFELADQGTIFLDEIGELPLTIQVKLLRVLQEGEFERVGGNETISVNVRIIAATNRDLLSMIRSGKFREDLYYRLHVFPIHNIPLRERREDIPVLIQHFLEKFKHRTGKDITAIRPQDMERLTRYSYPGNVRELENIIERAVILSSNNVLNLTHWHSPEENLAESRKSLKTMDEMQRELILEALKQTNWRVSGPDGAARILDMHPQTLFSRMRKLDINRND